jgi:hypothetical protein
MVKKKPEAETGICSYDVSLINGSRNTEYLRSIWERGVGV